MRTNIDTATAVPEAAVRERSDRRRARRTTNDTLGTLRRSVVIDHYELLLAAGY